MSTSVIDLTLDSSAPSGLGIKSSPTIIDLTGDLPSPHTLGEQHTCNLIDLTEDTQTLPALHINRTRNLIDLTEGTQPFQRLDNQDMGNMLDLTGDASSLTTLSDERTRSDSDVAKEETTKDTVSPASAAGVKRLLAEEPADSTPVSVKRARKDCEICAENKAISTFPLRPHLQQEEAACTATAAREACMRCWRHHLTAAMKHGNLDNAKCLYCEQALLPNEIRKLLSKKEFDSWLDQAAKTCMEKDEEFIACPSASCTWGCYMPKEGGNIFSCKVCEMRYCTDCQVLMHEDMTCKEYAIRKAELQREDAACNATVQATTKECPSCHTRIEKNHGCDHMRCLRCKHEFCWLCFADYKGYRGVARVGNSAHEPDCPWHTTQLQQRQVAATVAEGAQLQQQQIAALVARQAAG